jgi:hypothetical protein
MRQTAHSCLTPQAPPDGRIPDTPEAVPRLDHGGNPTETSRESGESSAVRMKNLRANLPRQSRKADRVERIRAANPGNPVRGHAGFGEEREERSAAGYGERHFPPAGDQPLREHEDMTLRPRAGRTVKNEQEAGGAHHL